MRKRCSRPQCTTSTAVKCFRTVIYGTYFRTACRGETQLVSTGRERVPEPTIFGTGPPAGQDGLKTSQDAEHV